MWEEMGIMKFGGEANTKKIYNDILEKYKEIIGVKDEIRRKNVCKNI